jgi:biopolymer transport protein ExbD
MAGYELECPACGAKTAVPRAEQAAAPVEREPSLGSLPAPEANPIGQRVANPGAPPAEAEPTARSAVQPARAVRLAPRVAFGPDAGGVCLGGKPLDMEEMDLTPMVDMTFLLLIFFMITASFSVQKSIEFPPPSPERTGASQTLRSLEDLEATSIIVRIDERNAITVDDEAVSPYVRLSDALRAKMSPERTELVVAADAEALHDTVISVIDAANEVGMQRIRMASGAE